MTTLRLVRCTCGSMAPPLHSLDCPRRPPRPDTRATIRRLRIMAAAYWQRQTKAGAERVRVQVMIDELVARCDPDYMRGELRSLLERTVLR